MTEETIPESLKDLIRETSNAMLSEYEHGFTDAHLVLSEGLKASLEKAKTMPQATQYCSGLELAITIINDLKVDMISQIQKKTADSIARLDAQI